MSTLFCAHCGFVVAEGDIDDPHEAMEEPCPRCAATGSIAWSPSELSREEIDGIMNPQSRTVARPGESPSELIERMKSEAMGQESWVAERKRAGRWLVRAGLIILIVGALAGGAVFYVTGQWGQAAVIGLLAGFIAVWIADRLFPN